MPVWPEWCEGELELTPHLLKRMDDRGFSEVDLRLMLEHARDTRADLVEGRHIVETRLRGGPWEVIVEPDEMDQLLVVVSARALARNPRRTRPPALSSSLAGEAVPPPHRPRHAASPSSPPDGRRAPPAPESLPQKILASRDDYRR